MDEDFVESTLQDRRKADMRIDVLEHEVRSIRSSQASQGIELTENTKLTKEIREILEMGKALFRFAGYVAKAAKWFSAVAIAVGIMIAWVKGKPPTP